MSSQTASLRYRHLRRNFPLFLFDYLLFNIAYNLLSPNSVVPEFVNQLTADPRIIGLVGTIPTLFFLAPQLLFSQWVARRTQRGRLLRIAIPFRTTIIFLAIGIAVLGAGNTPLILLIFIALYGIFWIGDGLITILWADMIGNTLPPTSRSTLFGLGQFGVALGAVVASAVVRLLLGSDAPSFPGNYALLFGIGGLAFVTAAFALASIKPEELDTPSEPGPTLRQFLPYVGAIFKEDHRFRDFALIRLALDLVTMAVPFYIIFGTDSLKVESSTLVGDSILLITIGNALISLVNNQVSRRYGPRAVMWIIAVVTVLMGILSVVSVTTNGLTALHGCFFMIGAISGSYAAGIFDYVITYAPADRRPIYMGLANTIGAAGNIAPLIGGFILSLTQSYSILFSVSLIAALIGAALSLRLADPRKISSQVPGDQTKIL